MDDREAGQHRGRGPRNYTRSEDRIRDDINDELTESREIDASEIEVEVAGGDVTLAGKVNTRYEKRLAEDLAEGVSGVKNVENRIRVQGSSQASATSSPDPGMGVPGIEQTTEIPQTTTGNK